MFLRVVILLFFTMPSIYVKKDLYDQLVQKGFDVTVFVNEAVEEKMEKKEDES